MRRTSIAIAVAVLAVGAAPAVAKDTNALRSAPRTVAPKPVSPVGSIAPVISQPAVAKPAVWIPTPSRGIKWSGVKYAVWIR